MQKTICYQLLIALLFPLASHAYSENPNIYPLGEKEAFMANTGVALTGSTGGVLFNPAGLASITTSKVSLSANSYLSIKTDYAPLDTVDGKRLNFTASGVIAIPSSVVSVQKIDDWTVAFSVLVPQLGQLNDMSNYDTTNFSIDIIQAVKNQLLLIGLTGANHYKDGYDYGFGCFVGTVTGSSNTSIVAQPKAGSGLTQTGYSSTAVNMEVQGLLCNAGIQKDYDQRLRWGASIRLPFYKTSGTAKVFSFTQSAGGGAATNSGIQSLSINYEIPMDIALGVRYQALEKLQLYGDASYQLPMSYKAVSAAATSIETRGALRLNAGAAYAYTEKIKFYGGLGLNPGTNVLKQTGDINEDFTVTTFGAEWVQKIVTTGLGVIVANTTGESLQSNGTKGGVNSKVFGVLLSGGFSF